MLSSTTDAQKRAKQNYKSKAKRITIDFWPSEIALFDWVSNQDKKQTYIKTLIKRDMTKSDK